MKLRRRHARRAGLTQAAARATTTATRGATRAASPDGPADGSATAARRGDCPATDVGHAAARRTCATNASERRARAASGACAAPARARTSRDCKYYDQRAEQRDAVAPPQRRVHVGVWRRLRLPIRFLIRRATATPGRLRRRDTDRATPRERPPSDLALRLPRDRLRRSAHRAHLRTPCAQLGP